MMMKKRATSEHLKRLYGPLAENQGQHLALTVLCEPSSLDSGSLQYQSLPNKLGGLRSKPGRRWSGDTTSCRMTEVTLHSHVRYKEI